MRTFTYSRRAGESGSALIPALMVVSALAMLGLSLLTSGVSGARAVTGAAEDYKLASAGESVGTLAAERLWSTYVRANGGAAGTIDSFRAYLTAVGLAPTPGTSAPTTTEGDEHKALLGLDGGGEPLFDDVAVDTVRVVRRDDGDATHLYLTVLARSRRGDGLATTPPQRAVQLVYTVEPAPFEGFDYGILTNNVNCIFCHTVVDSADRYYNHDPAAYGTFAKVKVGALQSMMIRGDGRPAVSDADADSLIAGTLYVRGKATKNNGTLISDWNTQSLKSCTFDNDGHIVEDGDGHFSLESFSPAGAPFGPGENLYLDYPTEYGDMVDGKLPTEFPPPFPDDGGVDPLTGMPTPGGSGNKIVDPNEFYAATQELDPEAHVSGGSITTLASGTTITTESELAAALAGGEDVRLGALTTGNVVLIGTEDDPILIEGTVAIDGDVVIQGYVKGEGVILAKGNVYVPSNVQYLDGNTYVEGDIPGIPTGPTTFGVAQDGTTNALGLACGGNLLIGDFLQPSSSSGAGLYDIVTGNPDGGYNFTLAEIAEFNRNEWSKTQPTLPGVGEDISDPSTWTVPNPAYVADYVPRYYEFGPGDLIPVFNLGSQWFDPATGTWRGPEAAFEWDSELLSMWDPADTTNPALFDPTTGVPIATISTLTPSGGWMSDEMLEAAIEHFKVLHPDATPLEIDGLLYTNNAIFGIVPRGPEYRGQMVVNGSLVCADLGLLAPGRRNLDGVGTTQNPPGSPYGVGLRLLYDERTKAMIKVRNPYSVEIRRALWNPSIAH